MDVVSLRTPKDGSISWGRYQQHKTTRLTEIATQRAGISVVLLRSNVISDFAGCGCGHLVPIDAQEWRSFVRREHKPQKNVWKAAAARPEWVRENDRDTGTWCQQTLTEFKEILKLLWVATSDTSLELQCCKPWMRHWARQSLTAVMCLSQLTNKRLSGRQGKGGKSLDMVLIENSNAASRKCHWKAEADKSYLSTHVSKWMHAVCLCTV